MVHGQSMVLGWCTISGLRPVSRSFVKSDWERSKFWCKLVSRPGADDELQVIELSIRENSDTCILFANFLVKTLRRKKKGIWNEIIK